MAQPSKGLGKGLSALMGEISPSKETPQAAPAEPTNKLPVSALVAGKYQPRRHFNDDALSELASSIEKHGLMQPIVVRQIALGRYEIIAGERRFRASKLAGMREVPVIIRTVDDAEALELALIENIQRADLNPLEEAAGYQRLMDEFGYTQEKLAPIVGKSRSHIANLLRLQRLPESVKARIDSGHLTMGHARALLMAKEPEELARLISDIGLSVRQAEDFARNGVPTMEAGEVVAMAPSDHGKKMESDSTDSNGYLNSSAGHSTPGGASKSARGTVTKTEDVLQLEAMLAENLGLGVSINTSSGQTGEVVISYASLSQLDEILQRLGGSI